MNFPHLPRLVALVAKFCTCERKVSNLIYYYCLSIFTNDECKQHKMIKKRPVAIEWLQAFYVINFFSLEEKYNFSCI